MLLYASVRISNSQQNGKDWYKIDSRSTDICHTPHQRTSMAQGRFYGGSGHRAVAQTHLADPKMPRAPSAFPFIWAPQASGDKPNPSYEGLNLGGQPPEARVISSDETHPTKLCDTINGRPKCDQHAGKSRCEMCARNLRSFLLRCGTRQNEWDT